MKPFVAALVLCPWLALSAWSQSPSPQPLTLQQFLDLSNDQAGASPLIAFGAGLGFGFDPTANAGQAVPGCLAASREPFPGNIIPTGSRLGPAPQPLPLVRQFFGLTDDQVTTILKNNSDYNT